MIPNTYKNFRASTSRAYYDRQYRIYKEELKKKGIWAVSSFALVDESKDKNHTGQYIVRVCRRFKTNGKYNYAYATCTIDKDGQFVKTSDGIPAIELQISEQCNLILCVCAKDFQDVIRAKTNEIWHPEQVDEDGNSGIRDIPTVHSTTSSHYSIFR